MNMPISLNPQSTFAPQHATPPCPHFGPCGGCQLQHLTYSAQLAEKASELRMFLEGAKLTLPDIQIHPSPPLGYRNRIRLTLAEVAGQLRAGYIRNPDPSYEAAPTFLPITQCPIAAPILWRAAEAVLAELNQRSRIWIERAPFTVDQLELFTAADESLLQISLYVRTSAKSLPGKFAAEFSSFCETLKNQIPALTGAGIYLLPARSGRSRRVEQPRPGLTWGSPGLNYTVQPPTQSLEADLTYWVPRTAFFQVNRFLIPELLSLISAKRNGQLAWDLYAGVGLFTRALAPYFAHITAVEVAEPAFTALCSARLPNRHAIKAAVVDFLETAVLHRDRPDLIVLDPPRTGAGAQVCELLGRVAAPTVIYVSCSPETLPSDLATLAAAGYAVSELHLLDLFPQTMHIETVAILTR